MVKIRITGNGNDVAEAAQLLRKVFQVLETSRPYPRRDSRLVSLYLDADLPRTPCDLPQNQQREAGS